jgi:hypothetical protein
MGLKGVLTIFISLLLISLLFFYFVPLQTLRFMSSPENNNFSLSSVGSKMQFYPNMRYPSNEISYKISDCTLQKENDMTEAFRVVENLTLLKFKPVLNNQEISITCQEKNRFDNDMFVAGEGGATKIIQSRNFNIILEGEILLIRSSDCPKPNVAMHELFHALGFTHSSNPDNLMYNVSSCGQTISNDLIDEINKLYLTPSEPDLIVENVYASMKGRFLSVNLSLVNIGLKACDESKIVVYAEDSVIKEMDIPALDIGQGEIISFENIFVPQIGVKEITVSAEASFVEIDKENNKIKLEIKND